MLWLHRIAKKERQDRGTKLAPTITAPDTAAFDRSENVVDRSARMVFPDSSALPILYSASIKKCGNGRLDT